MFCFRVAYEHTTVLVVTFLTCIYSLLSKHHICSRRLSRFYLEFLITIRIPQNTAHIHPMSGTRSCNMPIIKSSMSLFIIPSIIIPIPKKKMFITPNIILRELFPFSGTSKFIILSIMCDDILLQIGDIGKGGGWVEWILGKLITVHVYVWLLLYNLRVTNARIEKNSFQLWLFLKLIWQGVYRISVRFFYLSMACVKKIPVD
ncbi:hypothetical protein POVWA2_022510 [Plasmodium ovale wallikeri]|uniref:Uncharacterized protein n=1 Tax=Plasmodium ovale wallikeri TaxID=864142 RepID=A0A1A8YST5_PLAOA|nr:hypothetical protein POVWA1_022710 [Plasmodium ovale wallikeri]SBT34938.1 hypothetical protein POVWA2_022510 [Plasmodium ovale wallikeri]